MDLSDSGKRTEWGDKREPIMDFDKRYDLLVEAGNAKQIISNTNCIIILTLNLCCNVNIFLQPVCTDVV